MLVTGEYIGLSWSVWDYKDVEIGDRFYFVRVGEGDTGILISGHIDSTPVKDEDWSGKGRTVYYAGLSCESIADLDSPFITTSELMESFPGFDWTKGHSGRVLPQEIAEKLEEYWHTHF